MLQTYLILAKVARDIGDFQSSRFAYNYLRDMNIPSLMYDQVSLDMITIEVRTENIRVFLQTSSYMFISDYRYIG